MAMFSDDEGEDVEPVAVAVLIGKVLSPIALHATTILGAMKSAWGNPVGLKIRSVGGKLDNLFVAEFGDHHSMDRHGQLENTL